MSLEFLHRHQPHPPFFFLDCWHRSDWFCLCIFLSGKLLHSFQTVLPSRRCFILNWQLLIHFGTFSIILSYKFCRSKKLFSTRRSRSFQLNIGFFCGIFRECSPSWNSRIHVRLRSFIIIRRARFIGLQFCRLLLVYIIEDTLRGIEDWNFLSIQLLWHLGLE